MLKKMLRRITGGPVLPRELEYEAARDVLQMQKGAEKVELASRADARPEMLYFLAGDTNAAVRANVAANPATPVQANQILSNDDNADVRAELARKIARLLPGLSAGDQARLREQTLQILEKLAADELPRVRRIVAEEIKRSADLPKALILQLAQDAEITVAAPILQYSPMLSDADLREIIAASEIDGIIEAVAQRPSVGPELSDAIVATLDVPGVAALLVNPNAQIREDALEAIIDNATGIQSWHGPLAMRPALSIRAMRRIAGFVASALVSQMIERNSLDPAVAEDLMSRVRDRLKEETPEQPPADIKKLAAQGKITDDMLTGWIDLGQRAAALEALSLSAKLPLPMVNAIIASANGRAVASLVWKAGFSMRSALKVQSGLARITGKDLLAARHGTEYPMTPDEMTAMMAIYGAA